MTRTIAILHFDDMEELDAVGPWEVLAYWTRNFSDDGWRVLTASPDGGSVTAAKGLRIGADTSWDALPALDVVLHPGGYGTRALLADPAHLDWMRALRATTLLMTSVCTGSLVYAAAGLLAGRPATTHWESLALLAELDPSIEVRPTHATSVMATSSRAPASARASTWRCTSSPAWPIRSAPGRCAAASSTTPSHPCSAPGAIRPCTR